MLGVYRLSVFLCYNNKQSGEMLMKEKINNKYVYWGLTAFCVLAAIVFFFFCLYRWVRVKAWIVVVFQIFLPFIYGLAIAYILNPLVNNIKYLIH